MTEVTMMERLARAAQESKAWPAVFDAGVAETIVRAILTELRTPSRAMLFAAMDEAVQQSPDDRLADKQKWVWQAIIDSILSEKPE